MGVLGGAGVEGGGVGVVGVAGFAGVSFLGFRFCFLARGCCCSSPFC